jgi:hypothetical protein
MNVYEPAVDYSDNDWDVFSKWIKGVLITTDTTVTFTKKDGTKRVLRCTLRPDALPVQEVTESKEPRKTSDSTLSVYDLEANGWRSFTIRAVKRVEFEMSDD